MPIYQDHPKEKEIQEGKWLSEETLHMPEKRREAKGKGERETARRVPENSKERQESLLT